MDIKTGEKSQLLISNLFKISSLLVLMSTAFTVAFTDELKSAWSVFLLVYLFGFAGWAVIPYALALTPSRKAQSYGAALILTYTLGFIASVIYSLLSGEGLGWIFDDLLYSQLIFFNLIAGLLAASFLVLTANDRANVGLKVITPIAVAVLLVTQSLNSNPGSSLGNVFLVWTWESIVAVAIALIIGMVVLFFSDVRVSSFSLLVFSIVASMYQFMNVVHYFQGDKSSDPNDWLSVSVQKPSAIVFLQLPVALLCLGYSLYVLNFQGFKLSTGE